MEQILYDYNQELSLLIEQKMKMKWQPDYSEHINEFEILCEKERTLINKIEELKLKSWFLS
jgi:hypothetical protein